MVTITLNGWTITAGDYRTAYTLALAQLTREDEKEPPIDRVRAWAFTEINRQRNETRTAADALPDAHLDKLVQAVFHAQDPAPKATDYPALYGDEAAARKATPEAMAALITQAAATARTARDRADARAYKATQAVAAARTPDEIIAALTDTAD